LRQLFEKGTRRGISPDHIAKVENILAVLNRARRPADIAPAKRRSQRFLERNSASQLADHFSFRIRRCVRCGFARLSLKGDKIMRMKKPPHPGRVVRQECIEPLGLTVTEAAKRLGVTRQALNNLVNGKGGISAQMAVRLSKAFGSSPEVWLGIQMEYDLAQVEKEAQNIKVKRVA
jgi:antitoxin HigA-1